MHGGTFELTSEPGKGTVATVRLPNMMGTGLQMAS
jgi:signal transduction histidine kinase